MVEISLPLSMRARDFKKRPERHCHMALINSGVREHLTCLWDPKRHNDSDHKLTKQLARPVHYISYDQLYYKILMTSFNGLLGGIVEGFD